MKSRSNSRMGRPPGPQGPHKSSAPTIAMHTLARAGLTLEDCRDLTDEQLLALPGFGRVSLAWVNWKLATKAGA